MRSYAEDARYLEERVLQPLQRAVSLVRELSEVEALLKQKQEHVEQMEAKVQAATTKQSELTASMDRQREAMAAQL